MVTVADLILKLLEERPRTGFQITRLLQDRHGVLLRKREAAVYAALLELERSGYVVSREAEIAEGRTRRVYDLPVLEDLGAEA
jgi:DNA-binding PadR family transcriptional regulator